MRDRSLLCFYISHHYVFLVGQQHKVYSNKMFEHNSPLFSLNKLKKIVTNFENKGLLCVAEVGPEGQVSQEIRHKLFTN